MKIARRGFLGLFVPALAAAVLLPAAGPAEAEAAAELDVIEVKPEDSPLWVAYMEAQVKAKAEELHPIGKPTDHVSFIRLTLGDTERLIPIYD